jgi:hypothetical protein
LHLRFQSDIAVLLHYHLVSMMTRVVGWRKLLSLSFGICPHFFQTATVSIVRYASQAHEADSYHGGDGGQKRSCKGGGNMECMTYNQEATGRTRSRIWRHGDIGDDD